MDEFLKFKKSPIEYFIENKNVIYNLILYCAGLIVGVIIFSHSNELFQKAIDDLFNASFISVKQSFINNFCIYFSIFTLTVLLGLCLIGYPVLNLIPLILGTEIAIKLSYYYVNYNLKGIGYSLLMIIPESSLFITVLIFTIINSEDLSKQIYNLTKKSDTTIEINLKSYLKSYLLYAVIVALISIITACTNSLLSSIISL